MCSLSAFTFFFGFAVVVDWLFDWGRINLFAQAGTLLFHIFDRNIGFSEFMEILDGFVCIVFCFLQNGSGLIVGIFQEFFFALINIFLLFLEFIAQLADFISL